MSDLFISLIAVSNAGKTRNDLIYEIESLDAKDINWYLIGILIGTRSLSKFRYLVYKNLYAFKTMYYPEFKGDLKRYYSNQINVTGTRLEKKIRKSKKKRKIGDIANKITEKIKFFHYDNTFHIIVHNSRQIL